MDEFNEKKKKTKEEKWHDMKEIARAAVRVHKYAFKNSPKVSAAYIMVIVVLALIPFAMSWLNNLIIDTIIGSIQEQLGLTQELTYLLILSVGALIANSVLTSVMRYLQTVQRYDMVENFTMDMLEKYSQLDLEYYEDPQFNDLLQKVKENYNFRPTNLLEHTYNLINDIVTLLTSLVIIASFSIMLIPIVVAAQLPELINSIFLGRRKWGIWQAEAPIRRHFWQTSYYLEKEKPLMEIKVFGVRNYLLDFVNGLLSKFHTKQKSVEKKRGLNNSLLGILSGAGFGIALWVISMATLAGEITIGLFTFYLSTIRQFSHSVSGILYDMSGIYENGLYVVDVFKVLDFEPKIIASKKPVKVSGKAPTIEFKDVWFKYPNTDKYIFKGLNFKIDPKENIAIVGKNGAGKTTFVKLLSRFYDIEKGDILIDGVSLKNLDLVEWYKNLAVLSQEFVHYHFSSQKNIGFGNIDDMNNLDKIIEAAKLSGAHDFIQDYEHGYDQYLSKRFKDGTEPSTGQWQKIALARAFFKDAPILILDEPTSAIDPKSEFEIFEKLFDYAAKKTVIIISHRFSTVRNASKIIVLDEGEIIEQGSHEKLLKINGQYKQAFDLQKKGYEE